MSTMGKTKWMQELEDFWKRKDTAGFYELVEIYQKMEAAVRDEIAEKLSKLPFHGQFQDYDGATERREVTYTTDIVALENELRSESLKEKKI